MATHSSVASDSSTVKNIELAQALQRYMESVSSDDRQRVHAELARFIRWVGSDRKTSTLAPPEIGEYSDLVSARGTAPDATDRLSVVKAFLTFLKKQNMVGASLAQHLRVRKGRNGNARNRSQTESTVIRLTKEGHAELVNRLAAYRAERAQLAGEIRKAAQDKDVRENAPLEAAREAQGMLMSRIADLEATLRAAEVIDEDASGAGNLVTLGSTVTLKDGSTGKTMTCQIVEPNEASPLNSKISSVSPVGAAVLGCRPGQEVSVQTPKGDQLFQVVKTS